MEDFTHGYLKWKLARLELELTEAREQQGATSEILHAISRSPTDARPVFETIARNAVSLCGSLFANAFRFDGELLHFIASHNVGPNFVDLLKAKYPMRPDNSQVAGRVILTRSVVKLENALIDRDMTSDFPLPWGGGACWAFRWYVTASRSRHRRRLGRVGDVPKTQEDLLRTFADQAIIAIENVRLFEEVQRRTEELSRSLDELRAAQDRLVQTEKLASLGQLTAGIAHEIKNPINFVKTSPRCPLNCWTNSRNCSSMPPWTQSARQVAELAAMLKGNSTRSCSTAGAPIPSSRTCCCIRVRARASIDRSTSTRIVEESLNLAYHGARAEKKEFNITLENRLDPPAGEIDLFPQEIMRVLLNLISNGFYATASAGWRQMAPMSRPSLRPRRSLGDSVEIASVTTAPEFPPSEGEDVQSLFHD